LMQECFIGSCFSLRAFCRVGSSMSSFGAKSGVYATVSVANYIALGSSLSFRAHSKSNFGGNVSVLQQSYMGSSLSLRSFARLYEKLVVYGTSRVAKNYSVLEYTKVGSSVSLRQTVRVGDAFSCLSYS
jgi:hypothetical protein